jgi:hypothetical protein
MRRFAIIAAIVVVAVAVGVTIRVATSEAGWHILSDTAINTKRLCRDGLTYTWASGQTTDKPPASRPVGAPRWSGPIDLLVQSGPSSLSQDEFSWENQPMAGADVFTAGYAPVKNSNTVPASWYPYSHPGTVPFRRPLTPVDETVRIDTQPNGNDATEVFLPVEDCYLFGPIDVAPGDASNTVDLSAGASVTVALLSTSTFKAANVSAGSVRFGATGTEAAPTASSKTDVNGDGRNDLRLTFATGETGIRCTTAEASLSATDPGSKKTFYESDAVTPINC